MKKTTLLLLLFIYMSSHILNAQQKNFIDQPYLDVSGEADTLIIPDQVFMSISLSEKDTKNRESTEDLEKKMIDALKKLGIDIEQKLNVLDMMSNYKDYILKKTDIQKAKKFELEVSTADMATKVLVALEEMGISNAYVTRLDHTKMKEIENIMRMESIKSAKAKAMAFAAPLQQKIGAAIYISENSGSSSFTTGAGLNEVVISGYNLDASKKGQAEVNFRKLKVVKIVNVKFILQ
jgi:uncharacterized protein